MGLSIILLLFLWVVCAGGVGTLAMWWLAATLYCGKGPFRIAERLRDAVVASGDAWLVDELSCFWCVSLWAGLIVMPIAFLAWPLLLPLAASGAVQLLGGGGRIVWRYMTEE